MMLSALILIGAGCAKPKDAKSPPAVDAGTPNRPSAEAAGQPGADGSPRSVIVPLKDVKGGTSQYGRVILTDLPGNSTRINIFLDGARSKAVQPAAIYAGTCATQQSEPQYQLNPVVNGRSSTTLAVNLSAIIDKSPQALKVREDGTSTNLPFAACAELK